MFIYIQKEVDIRKIRDREVMVIAMEEKNESGYKKNYINFSLLYTIY